MKTYFNTYLLLFLFIALPLSSQAQIINEGFEQWTLGQPEGWYTSNLFGLATPITQSSTSHSGSSALRGEVVLFGTDPYPVNIIAGVDGLGFLVSQRYASLKGFYQFSPVGGDQFQVLLLMSRDENFIGGGEFITENTAASYTEFTLDIIYYSDEVPDLCDIVIVISGPTGDDYHAGSAMLLDDLSFSGISTSVQDNMAESQIPKQFSLSQSYPNPFNPACTMEYSVPEISEVTIKIFNILGTEITTLFQGVNGPGLQKVVFRPDQLPGGVYLYEMRAKSLESGKTFVEIKKAMYCK